MWHTVCLFVCLFFIITSNKKSWAWVIRNAFSLIVWPNKCNLSLMHTEQQIICNKLKYTTFILKMYYRKFWSRRHAHWVFLLWAQYVLSECICECHEPVLNFKVHFVLTQANMKPRPRVTRTKWSDRLNAEPERSGKCRWHRDEKKKLLVALNRLNGRAAGGKTDIDYAFLRKYLPPRSLSEVRPTSRNEALRCCLSLNNTSSLSHTAFLIYINRK